LAASSAVSSDMLNRNGKSGIIAARITLMLIAVFAVILARNLNSSVFQIVSFAWAGFGAAFGPVVLFSLFLRRTNKYGALAGMLFGGVMIFVWTYQILPYKD
ncbi:sodium:proline symporter, partial [Lacrimispora saccharolytica]|nr:sodium:proline symporter [Lacrimispora saccharolytica]